MTISKWEPIESVRPSPTRRGAATTEEIYVAPSRAFGMVEAPFVKAQALKFAGEAFFSASGRADKADQADFKALVAAYNIATRYRNNIAHGMTIGHHLEEDGSHSGFFLTPPSYASKKVGNLNTSWPEPWFLTYNYYYTVDDLRHHTARFQDILDEAVRLAHHLNDKYQVIPNESLHP